MSKISVRKFEAFAMHAHHDTPAVYTDLFKKLADLPRKQRVIQTNEVVYGFPIIEADGARFFIRAVEGDLQSNQLVLDTETGGTRENILEETEVLGQATHLVIAPAKRRAVIEYVRRGPKAATLGAAIEGILRRRYSEFRDLRFFFNPIIRETFI